MLRVALRRLRVREELREGVLYATDLILEVFGFAKKNFFVRDFALKFDRWLFGTEKNIFFPENRPY